MKLAQQHRQHIISALETKLEKVVAERKRDAEDCSSKWNDARERNASQLDQERDEIYALIQVLAKPSGEISW